MGQNKVEPILLLFIKIGSLGPPLWHKKYAFDDAEAEVLRNDNNCCMLRATKKSKAWEWLGYAYGWFVIESTTIVFISKEILIELGHFCTVHKHNNEVNIFRRINIEKWILSYTSIH